MKIPKSALFEWSREVHQAVEDCEVSQYMIIGDHINVFVFGPRISDVLKSNILKKLDVIPERKYEEENIESDATGHY